VKCRARAAVACALALVAAAAAGCSGDAQRRAIDVRYSHFTVGEVTVRAGEPVTFSLQNDDPIEHEWIVGSEEVHARHRTGTERYHGSVPTEVSLRPYERRETTVTFAEPGDYRYICHLPGHEQYGMVGVVHVHR
jgi:uncharacterized cupredoxin-like copper-binding protein